MANSPGATRIQDPRSAALTVGVLDPDLDEAVEDLAPHDGPIGDRAVRLAGVVRGRGLGRGGRGQEALRDGSVRRPGERKRDPKGEERRQAHRRARACA